MSLVIEYVDIAGRKRKGIVKDSFKKDGKMWLIVQRPTSPEGKGKHIDYVPFYQKSSL